MERRIFISFFRLLPLGLLFGCNKSDKKIAETKIGCIQDKIVKYFNQGKIEPINSFLDENFFFVDDRLSGDIEYFNKRLHRLYKYYKKKQLLPLEVIKEKRKALVLDDVSWIVSELKAHSQSRIHGLLTQIFKRNGADWKIIHHHFSS